MRDDQPADFAMTGYAVGYAPAKGEFRVYISLVLAAGFVLGYYIRQSEIALLVASLFLIAAYYYYPLVETGKVRLGAGEHGVFIEGFGVIPWRSIGDIRLVKVALRTMQNDELHIQLSRGLPDALMADWRSMPYHRLLMRLPWTMGKDNIVRVKLEPFAGKPEDIVAALKRNRKFFGGV